MRATLILCLLTLTVAPVRAHFVWLVPDPDKGTVRMVFSDTLAPDENPDLLDRIKQTQVFSVGERGAIAPVKFQRKDDVYVLAGVEGRPPVYFATCRYGIFQRGQAEPALLTYYAKTFTGARPDELKKAQRDLSARLDLDIALTDTPGSLRVLWKGKPLPKAKVFIVPPGGKRIDATTDDDGGFKLDDSKLAAGLYGIRIGHTVKEAGELAGKKYTSTRHWATLVFDARTIALKPGKPGKAPDSSSQATAIPNRAGGKALPLPQAKSRSSVRQCGAHESGLSCRRAQELRLSRTRDGSSSNSSVWCACGYSMMVMPVVANRLT